MTTKEIINLDFQKEENHKIIQKVLKQIKPLSKYSEECEIPLSAIEKAISIMCKKYSLRIESIRSDVYGNENNIIWDACITNDKNFKVIDHVFGISVYELFSKIAIRLYAEVKKGISKR